YGRLGERARHGWRARSRHGRLHGGPQDAHITQHPTRADADRSRITYATRKSARKNELAKRTQQKRQAAVHAVVDARVRAVELLVHVLDAVLREPARQNPGAVVEPVLIAPAAVEVNSPQRLQVLRETLDEMDRIVAQPLPPALRNQLPRLEIERHPQPPRILRVRVVGGRHAEIHEAMHLGAGRVRLAPYGLEKTADSAVVDAPFGRREIGADVDRPLAAGP